MERYDIIIIGTGPAGVSAAITATIRNKKIMLIGSKDLSSKIAQGHTIENYPGLPSIAGADFGNALKKHLENLNISIHEDRVSAVYSMGDYFSVQVGQDMIEADSVILATGVVAGKPINGESELVGRGVSYCATCDAPLYRGKDVIVIGYSQKEEEEARFLSEVTNSVTYFQVYKGETNLPESIKIVQSRPSEIKHVGDKNIVVDAEGNTYEADGIFVLRDAISPGQLVPGLKTEGAHIVVDRNMATSINGCFACGDIVGLPYQYIKSAGEGNIAALSAVGYIDKKRLAK
ncbi:MAG: NAD(P)/FAD-dependent oxidoreductase [Lachnospiraceae bacterium]|nr:NAD(P)/FAD-dependent oxidoreductase [Lachnospiraceae bacterium]